MQSSAAKCLALYKLIFCFLCRITVQFCAYLIESAKILAGGLGLARWCLYLMEL